MGLTARFLAGVLLTGLAILFGGFVASRMDPVVERLTVPLPDWPTGRPPITLALMTDIHLGNASMDRRRLDAIVDQVNARHPDLVLLGGDFLSAYDKADAPARSRSVADALRRLDAPLGTVAVLGNHDYGTAPALIAKTLSGAGIVVLQNQATVRGPLAIGGLGDGYSGNSHIPETLAAMAPLHGARIMLAHTPADAAKLPDDIALLLAGHTHCGQVVLPIVGALVLASVPRRYLCGVVHDGARTVIVSAGLGTSNLPLRIHAPPDVWLVTLGPPPR